MKMGRESHLLFCHKNNESAHRIELCKPTVVNSMHVLNLVHLWIELWILWSIFYSNRLSLKDLWINMWKTVDNLVSLWIKCIIFIGYSKNV